MNTIKMPQINANENEYQIREITFSDGAYVQKNEIIAYVSSSKATIEVKSEYEGFIQYKCKVNDSVQANRDIAIIFDKIEELDKYADETKSGMLESEKHTDFIVTKLAKKFATENNISNEEIALIGKKLIKTEDLQAILDKRIACSETKTLFSSNQKGVINTVTKSHKEIPQAFLLVKVSCDNCERYIEKMLSDTGIIGYGEIFTKILLRLHEEYPLLYSSYVNETEYKLADRPEVGITMDFGEGLFIPVVSGIDANNMTDIAEKLLEYKMKAMDGSFEAEDLAGGNITISLNPGQNVISVIPVIVPGQTCMLSVGTPMKELKFDEDKNIIESSYLYLGFAYDHRMVNGSRIMEFAEAVARELSTF